MEADTPDLPGAPPLPPAPSTGGVDIDGLIDVVDATEFGEARHIGRALSEKRVQRAKEIVLGEEMARTLEAVSTPEELSRLMGAAMASTMFAVLSGDIEFKDGRDAAAFMNSVGNLRQLLTGGPTSATSNLTELTDEQRQAMFAELKAKAIEATSGEPA